LAVPHFYVGKAAVNYFRSVIQHFCFAQGEWTERLAEKHQSLNVDRDFPSPGSKQRSLDSNPIAEVKKPQNVGVQVCHPVPFAVYLEASTAVAKMGEHALANVTDRQEPACNAYMLRLFGVLDKGVERSRKIMGRFVGVSIRLDSQHP
jgi:hypothetical protein